ncbi:MAG: DUF1153 domain-containing protein [Magnetospirillum sp. WYHS-4]
MSSRSMRIHSFIDVVGPTGRPLTRDDLPPPGTQRWVMRRKAEVVAGVRAGLISLEEACALYKLSMDEFAAWQRLLDRHGLAGLRTTRTQVYRDTVPALAAE